jgi:hypothetical protein
MALYYYSSERDDEIEADAHSTLFQVRPESTDKPAPRTARQFVRAHAPPFLVRGLRAIRRRIRGR